MVSAEIVSILVALGGSIAAYVRESELKKNKLADEFRAIHEKLYIARRWLDKDPQLIDYSHEQRLFHSTNRPSKDPGKRFLVS